MVDPLPAPKDLLPHREPFLFVDRLTALVPGESVSGVWKLTGEEPFFAGHFPGRPTLPGVLMLEALAQVGACGVLYDETSADKLPLFGGASKVRFRRQVVPGDELSLEAEILRRGSRAGKARGTASVDGEVACTAEITFVLVDLES
ncbi:MAG: 3-hydroxyacyl-ACP dehydratase FabZ [Actinomycetota bacterium]